MADLTVRGLVEIVLKGGQIPKEVRADFEKLKTSLRSGGEQANFAAAGLRNLGATMAAVFGASQLVRWATDAVTEFAKVERQLGALRAQIGSLSEANRAGAEDVEPFIQALSKQYGIVDDQLVPAMGRLVLGLGNVKAAQEVLALSAKFAANGFGDVQSNAEALSRAIQMGTTKSLVQFGATASDAGDDLGKLGQAMEQVQRTAAGLPSGLHDAQAVLDQFALASDQAKDKFAELVVEFGKWAASFGSFNPMALGTPILPTMTQKVDTEVYGPTQQSPLEKIIEERDKAAREKANEEKADAAKKALEAQATLDASFWDATNELYKDDVDNRKAALDAKLAAATKRNVDEIALAEELNAKQSELNERWNQELMDADLSAIDARLEAAKSMSVSQVELIASMLDEKQRIEEEKENAAFEAEKARLESENIETEKLEEVHQKRLKAIKDKYAGEKSRIELRWEDLTAREKTKIGLEIAAQSVQAAQAAFGQSKALAAAATIINTAMAIVKTLTELPYPANLAMAAVIGAMGAAQLARINSTNFAAGGGGFDDPAHDRLAYAGGDRWAQDMVRNMTEGLAAGFQTSIGRSSVQPLAAAVPAVAGGDGGMVINFHGPVVGSERRVARKLYRLVQRGKIADRGKEAF